MEAEEKFRLCRDGIRLFFGVIFSFENFLSYIRLQEFRRNPRFVVLWKLLVKFNMVAVIFANGCFTRN